MSSTYTYLDMLADQLLGEEPVNYKENRSRYEKIDHPKKKRDRCSSCGFRVRGANHNEGRHHNSLKRKND